MEPGATVVGILVDLLLHERFTEAHVRRTFHLTLDENWVERAPAVVSHPDLLHLNDSRRRYPHPLQPRER